MGLVVKIENSGLCEYLTRDVNTSIIKCVYTAFSH